MVEYVRPTDVTQARNNVRTFLACICIWSRFGVAAQPTTHTQKKATFMPQKMTKWI